MTSSLDTATAPARVSLPLRIRILRRFNPIIVAILRSPLHGMMSSDLLVLEYRGQKTGRAHSIPLAYVTRAGQSYCGTRSSSAWWKNFTVSSPVSVWMRGERLDAHAERLASSSPEARLAFVAFLRANRGTAKLVYNVRVDDHGAPDASDLEREIHNSAVVRIARMGELSMEPEPFT
jgi:hypothetical protein